MINTQPLQQTLIDYFDKQRKVYPCHTNRASDIGHPCMRYLVFCRTRWSDKLLPEIDLQIIFNEGNSQEEAVKKTLQEAGFILTQQQRGYVEAPQKLTGHLDTFISHPIHIPKPIPAEIKGLSTRNWGSINSVEDMINHKEWYIRKYPPQLMTYCYMTSEPEGLFILKNKQTGKIKFIPVALDFAYMESILKKSEEVNRLVDAGTIPEGIDDLEICQRCDFRHICFKDQTFGSGILILNDNHLLEKVKRVEEIEAVSSECKGLKDEIGEQVKERAKQNANGNKKFELMLGDYVLSCAKTSDGSWRMGKTIKL